MVADFAEACSEERRDAPDAVRCGMHCAAQRTAAAPASGSVGRRPLQGMPLPSPRDGTAQLHGEGGSALRALTGEAELQRALRGLGTASLVAACGSI